MDTGRYYFLNFILKYNSTKVSSSTMLFATITGPLLMANAYTSHTIALVITIAIIQLLRSPTLLDCHDLYTCGTKVMAVRKDPKYPIYSTMFAGIANKLVIRP